MPLTVTVNTVAECLRTDCNILGVNKKNDLMNGMTCTRQSNSLWKWAALTEAYE
jgi:hypothetical protein